MILEDSARVGDHRTFATLVEAIDWSARQPRELTTAIDLALSLEMTDLAIALAQVGSRLFPGDERVQSAAEVLAPPVARITRLPHAKGLDASTVWLDEQAGQYKGQWVAVREGQLLGAAKSLQELEALIGHRKDAINTIVTKVL